MDKRKFLQGNLSPNKGYIHLQVFPNGTLTEYSNKYGNSGYMLLTLGLHIFTDHLYWNMESKVTPINYPNCSGYSQVRDFESALYFAEFIWLVAEKCTRGYIPVAFLMDNDARARKRQQFLELVASWDKEKIKGM